jgi:aryl-alcohol dehydrogenase-like predicted oxidoreductase
LSAFDELARAGTVGAVGASNYSAEQLAEAVEISELEGLTRYEWVQNSFSLLDRDDAETVFPVCHEHGLGYEAFGPLAGGWLAGRYRRGQSYPEGSRMTQRPDGYRKYEDDAVFDALEAFEREALGGGVSMAGLAIAWLLGVPEVSAVVVGPTTAEQLTPVREALSLQLEPEEHEHLRGLFA